MNSLLNVDNFMQSCNLYHYFSDHFSSFSFRKLSLLLECSRCLIHTLVLLPRTLPLTLLVYNNARGTLGNSFAIVTLVGHSFHVSSITFLVDSHVCSQRNSSVLPKRPREHMTVPLLFPFVFVILANYWKMTILTQGVTAFWLILWYLRNQDILCWMLVTSIIFLFCYILAPKL